MTDSASPIPPDDSADPRAAHRAWRQARLAQVSGPVGNTALVDYQPVDAEETPVRGLPATVWRVPGEPGVRVRPTGELALITADGTRLVTGETLVPSLGPDGFPLLRSGDITVDAFSLDGTDSELRIYDAAAPTRLAFAGIEVADYDPAWVLPAVFRPAPEIQRTPWGFTRASDDGHTKAVPGTVEATIDGVEYSLTVFADGHHLVLVFADATTGRTSYAPGRFLRFPGPAGAIGENAEPQSLTLDFNRAFVPPCGFSDFYSCPIPPPQNRIRAAVNAGELRATATTERPGH
ncbi:DUF1684 domain-containing protein [Nakamurella flava]|uniref:DUF1684 domain-containing protein n=1 Tax=Nakamurella flava TaxID=2576308 RepID=A0A4U6QJT8_9ACTN|nr:DUF1684 domain-containing protein [Nakamurella flava]TKV60362.1 DUF1684 domain-containing protein [Nakamurella flava]